MALVLFEVGGVEVRSEWNNSATARKIRQALPLQAAGNYWGGEFYFPVSVKAPLEKDAREVVEPGTVAYWPGGACLCLFWGATPASERGECRAASKVNIVGKVLNAEVLPLLKKRQVRVRAAE